MQNQTEKLKLSNTCFFLQLYAVSNLDVILDELNLWNYTVWFDKLRSFISNDFFFHLFSPCNLLVLPLLLSYLFQVKLYS